MFMAVQKVDPLFVFGTGPVSQGLVCPICHMILHHPVQARCEHVFCRDCLEDFCQKSKEAAVCPIDSEPISQGKEPDPSLLKMLRDLKIRCPEPSCRRVVELDAFYGHRSACRLEKIACEKGCGSELVRKDSVSHDCVNELRQTVQVLRGQVLELRVAEELKCQRNLEVEIRSSAFKMEEIVKKTRESLEEEMAKTNERISRMLERVHPEEPADSENEEDHIVDILSNNISNSISGKLVVDNPVIYKGQSKSGVSEIGGAHWQMIITETDRQQDIFFAFLKCHGLSNHLTNHHWEIKCDISLLQLRGELPAVRVILIDQCITAQRPLIGLPGVGCHWIQSSTGAMRMEFSLTLYQLTICEDARLKKKNISYDFKLPEIDGVKSVLVSPDVAQGGFTWNLVLFGNRLDGFDLRLACNRSVDQVWGRCSVVYELKIKDKMGGKKIAVGSEDFSQQSRMSLDFCRISPNEIPSFVVRNTLATEAMINLHNISPPKQRNGGKNLRESSSI